MQFVAEKLDLRQTGEVVADRTENQDGNDGTSRPCLQTYYAD